MKLKRDLDRRVPNMNGLDRRVPNMVFSQTFTSSDLNLCLRSSSPKMKSSSSVLKYRARLLP
jgi:hypothetical protein